jgi:hypothetical protein
VPVSDKGIALSSDLKDRFGNYTPSFFNPALNASRGGGNMTAPDGRLLTVRSDERFVNWMRTAALPQFRKLWGRIDGIQGGGLEAGDVIQVDIMNRWNTYSFDGQKAIVLVGASAYGTSFVRLLWCSSAWACWWHAASEHAWGSNVMIIPTGRTSRRAAPRTEPCLTQLRPVTALSRLSSLEKPRPSAPRRARPAGWAAITPSWGSPTSPPGAPRCCWASPSCWRG